MFISYAQNFEDVLLNRVFADKKQGCYIDIGAQHPLYDSVTKAFYDRGWQGINIEPVKEYYDLLVQERSRDLNLNLAVGETESELDFFELEGTGLSTFDRETATRLANEGNYKINSYQVPILRLATICQKHLNSPIDFLKIDVEGWEEKVILGNDWAHFRPTIILLEATIPNSPTRTKTNINSILQGQNYQHVYFDGLNDYYLANESSELKEHFATPPNVFDKFITYHLSTARAHAKNLEAVVQAREDENDNIKQQLLESDRHNHILNNRLENENFEIKRLTNILTQSQNTAQENSNNLYQKNTQLQNQLAEKNQQLNITQESINNLNQKTNDFNQENTQLQNQLAEKNQQFNTSQKSINNLNQEINNLNQENTQLRNQLANKNQQLHIANQSIVAIKTSKFWKMRTVWFKVKNSLGIKGK